MQPCPPKKYPFCTGLLPPPASWDRRSPDKRSLVDTNLLPHNDGMNITGNTVFIPGATSGIGQALAVALHEKGNTVVVGGRRREKLDELAARYPGMGTVVIDTTDPGSITDAAHAVLCDHPDLNVLITMAGVMNVEDWTVPTGFRQSAEEIVTTNILGPIRLIAAFIEHLQGQPNSTIMTVSSGLAFAPLKMTPSYNASKAAIHMLTESLRLQLADTSVELRELVPPSVRTGLIPGQEESESAMPLQDFIDEVMSLLEDDPDAPEILVERAKFLRYGEARGDYADVVAALNS